MIGARKDPSCRWHRLSAWQVLGGDIGILILEKVSRNPGEPVGKSC
jgi:hypothetical protein